MAAAFVQSTTADTGGADPIVYAAINATTGNAIVGSIWLGTQARDILGVTDNAGNTYVILYNPTDTTFYRAALFYALNITGNAALVVSVDLSGSASGVGIVHEVSGVALSAALDQSVLNPQNAPGLGANDVTSTGVTTTTDGQYVVGFFGEPAGIGTTWTHESGQGWTARVNNSSSSRRFASSDQVQSAKGAIAYRGTLSVDGEVLTGILTLKEAAAGGTAALTGTATASITEVDVVTGGKTIILTLTGDTFVAAGTGPIGSTADTQALIDGISAASSPANGWNAEWRDKEVTTAVVRTSATVATITMSSQATLSGTYDISAQETVTATIPAAVLTSAVPTVATPTFTVSPVAGDARKLVRTFLG